MFVQGSRIRKIREYNGIKQTAMAYDLGVSQSWLSKVEAGEIEPDIQSLYKIADYLKVSLSDLMKSDFVIQTQNNYDQSKGVYIESELHYLKDYVAKLEKLIAQKDALIEKLSNNDLNK
jgi:transcriptional regulator with XRE-family HTH domain